MPPRVAGSRLRETLIVAAVALVVAYGFFLEYFPPFQRVHLWSDAAGYHYPLQRYAFDTLKQGRLPLWDPSIYCGIPLLANVQAALLYPPTWVMFAAALPFPSLSFKGYSVFVFLHVWAGFVLAYLWFRSRRQLLPSVLAAAVFAWGGFMVWETLHPGVLGAMTWMPLGFWGIDQALDRRDWRPLWKVSAAAALAFLAGYPAAWLVTCVMFGVYAIAGRRPVRMGAGVLLALAATGPLVAAQLLPTLDARSLMELEDKYGAGAYSALTLAQSFFFGNYLDFNPNHPTNYEPGCLYFYLGLPALFAIGWAVFRHRPGPYIQPLLAMAFALLFASPPDFLVRAVALAPVFEHTMQPFNYFSGVTAMAALITAIALADFFNRRSAARAPLWLAILACAGLLAWSAREIVIAAFRGGHYPSGSLAVRDTVIALALFAVGIWSLRQSQGRLRALVAGVLLFAVAVDYRAFGAPRWFNSVEGDVDNEYASFGIIGIDNDAFRAMVRNAQYRELTYARLGPHPVLYRALGMTTPEGFDPFLSTAYKRFIEHWTPFETNRLFNTDPFNDDMMQSLGVRFVVVRSEDPKALALAASPKFRRLGRNDIYCHVYEYLLARAPYGWENDAAGAIQPVGWTPEVREFAARSAQGGRLFLVEQFYPGWRATVDGRPAAIERWRGAFQAVAVAPGEHRVRFEYDPSSLKIGSAVSAVSWLALAAVAWSSRRRRLSAAPPDPRPA